MDHCVISLQDVKKMGHSMPTYLGMGKVSLGDAIRQTFVMKFDI